MATNALRLCRKRQILSNPLSQPSYTRNLHASSTATAAYRQRRVQDLITGHEAMKIMAKEYEDDDTPSGGHRMLRQHRQLLYYLRLIEHDMPRLVAFRKQFVPPDASTPIIVRSVHYAGEEHPATLKRVIVVPVDLLQIRDEAVIHTLKLLAGPRWTPNPPADAGTTGLEDWGNGFIKISCERFPEASMNLKWASDVLDKLITEAHVNSGNFKEFPVDERHVHAKARKAKKGEHLRGRTLSRPTLRDFPKEWLPEPKTSAIDASYINIDN